LRTRLGQRPKNNGAPTLLFISSAALRVTDVARRLKARQLRGEKAWCACAQCTRSLLTLVPQGGDVAKLFAKHFKVEDHVRYLKTTKLSAAAGTPDRIGKLLELGMRAFPAHGHLLLHRS
jgi:protein CMS1